MKALQNQKGFTLIELVVIIVILGILAVIAIPKFVDISAEANAAALQGVAGGM
jgi:MSHA pilin protein MshA